MRTLAIVGANGQVGTEICLLLSAMKEIRVVPIVRSELGAVLLRRAGLDCRIGSAADPEKARELFQGCDMAADFSLPRGAREDGRRMTRRIIENATALLPPGAPFVFMSTVMAFGVPAEATAYSRRLFARTSYGVDKRRAEHLTRFYGLRYRRPVYMLRLGQVHGELQRVSRSMLATVSQGKPIALRGGGTSLSDTVFCSTIAGALALIARGGVPEGMYTMLEAPEWSWRALY
jgi:nucleoside-diphosphate-sugar epimerase